MADDAVVAELVAELADRGARGPHGHDQVTLWEREVPADYLPAVRDWAIRHGAQHFPDTIVPQRTHLATGHHVPPTQVAAHWLVPLTAIEQDTIERDVNPPATSD